MNIVNIINIYVKTLVCGQRPFRDFLLIHLFILDIMRIVIKLGAL